VDSKNKWSFGVFVALRSHTWRTGDGLWLVKHNYGEKKWSLPGGGLELGENIIEGVCREGQEETGFHIGVLNPPVAILSLKKSLGALMLFNGHIFRSLGQPNPEEISDAVFFGFQEMAELSACQEIYPAQFGLVELFRLTKKENWPVYDWPEIKT